MGTWGHNGDTINSKNRKPGDTNGDIEDLLGTVGTRWPPGAAHKTDSFLKIPGTS